MYTAQYYTEHVWRYEAQPVAVDCAGAKSQLREEKI